MTKQKIVVSIASPIILGLAALGFNAMSTNQSFAVSAWVPMGLFALAGLGTVGLILYLMWDLIMSTPEMVARLRIQSPIILKRKESETKSITTINGVKKRVANRLEHDGVVWEDGGWGGFGTLVVHGPLCPKDLTPLATKFGEHIDTNINYDKTVSSWGGHSKLVCPECNAEYVLGEKSKSIKDSLNEVRSRFEGKRRREQEI